MGKNKTALITGATGGLGEAFCREFIRHGYDLVITGRSSERLRETMQKATNSLPLSEGQKVTAIPADLNQEDAPELLVKKIHGAGVHVDVLVNNAGFGLAGQFVRQKPRVQEAMLRVNMMAPTRLCRLLLPDMLHKGYGGILNVASTGGFVAGPNNNVYCASKAYLLHFTEALAHELRDTPIHVTALCPGAVYTGFARRADMESAALFHYGVMEPDEVASIGYMGLADRRTVVVPGLLNRAVITAAKFAPRCLSAMVSGMLQKPGRMADK